MVGSADFGSGTRVRTSRAVLRRPHISRMASSPAAPRASLTPIRVTRGGRPSLTHSKVFPSGSPSLPPDSAPVDDISSVGFSPIGSGDPDEPPLYFVCRASGSLTLERTAKLYFDEDEEIMEPSSHAGVSGAYIAQRVTSYVYRPESSPSGVPCGANDASFSGCGKRLACGYNDGTLAVFDVSTSTPLWHQRGTMEACTSVSYAPQSNVVVAASAGGSLGMWDARCRSMIRRVKRAHDGAISSAEFHPDGTVVMTAGLDGLARIWDVTSGALLSTMMGSDGERGLGTAVFSPNGRFALFGSILHPNPETKPASEAAGTIHPKSRGYMGLWDLTHTGERLRRIRRYDRVNQHYWMSATFARSMVVAGTELGRIALWDVDTTEVLADVACRDGCRVALSLDFDEASNMLVSGGIGSKHASVWRVTDRGPPI